MPDPKQPVPTDGSSRPPKALTWIVAAFLGTFTELFADALRHFATDLKGGTVDFSFLAVLSIALCTAIIVVPIFLLSKASAHLTGERAERVIFIVCLLASAFLMPPLDWFAKLALGH
ncbi:MAG TPA: hypothetical protein VK574_13530 [Terracidiphilus sp.]|nr:hypothetical protein [Terracidiphilus sp.]